jgi:hypothetical protein
VNTTTTTPTTSSSSTSHTHTTAAEGANKTAIAVSSSTTSLNLNKEPWRVHFKLVRALVEDPIPNHPLVPPKNPFSLRYLQQAFVVQTPTALYQPLLLCCHPLFLRLLLVGRQEVGGYSTTASTTDAAVCIAVAT